MLRDMAYGNHPTQGPEANRKQKKFIGADYQNPIWGTVKSSRKRDIQASERRMVDQLNQLVTDESTQLPVLPDLVEAKDKLDKEKELGIDKISLGAKTKEQEKWKQLYKSGVSHHGRIESAFRDVGEDFKSNIEKTMDDYSSKVGGIEQEAQKRLLDIRSAVDTVHTKYKGTAGFKGKFATKEYDTSINPRTVAYEKKDELFDYDYLTGKRRK
tara:strand:- start:7853 stop:8491 length:639 start_codon:yes stop_codon:yes gene_type:complete